MEVYGPRDAAGWTVFDWGMGGVGCYEEAGVAEGEVEGDGESEWLAEDCMYDTLGVRTRVEGSV